MNSSPKPILLAMARLDRAREHVLRTALRLNESALLRTGAEAWGELRSYRSVVLDGLQPIPKSAVAQLQAFVENGGALLAIGAAPATAADPLAALLGVVAETARPQCELFSKCSRETNELLERIDAEFAVVEALAALQVLHADVRALLYVNWALKDEPAAVERRIGDGRIVTSSLGSSSQALLVPALGVILRRALRSPLPAAAGRRTITSAIVGYGPAGGMGFVHGSGIARTAGLQLAAVCDLSDSRRAAATADFPGIAAHVNAADLARDPAIQLVLIATPPETHAALALQMLEAGKHVACEKPLCLTTEEADSLIAAARANGLMLSINQNRRWDPDYLAVQRAVHTGLLGDIFNVETFVGSFEHPCRYWHSDAQVSGGVAFDWGSHYIDWTLQLLPGLPRAVSALAHKRVWHDVTNADQMRVRMLWSDGREAEFIASDVAAVPKPKFYIQGTAGTLAGHYRPLLFERLDAATGYEAKQPHFAEAPATLLLARYESGYGITETKLPPQPQQPFAFHRNIADHLLLGDELAVTPESVRSVIRVLEAAEASAKAGGELIPLEK
jgi:predicted dehydrogenase